MNTPAHIVVNLVVLGKGDSKEKIAAVIVGSVLPDLPLFLFYIIEKMVCQTPEKEIWSRAYYDPNWQYFIDFFNSVPIMCVGLALAIYKKSTMFTALFLSMLLHVCLDFPLHHDDAHRHFFPLSDWRFESPFSYWDPAHYGTIFASVEVLLVVASSILLYRRYQSRGARLANSILIFSYALYFGYALVVWA